ncbi:MAG: kelch repeat-containing protein [Myxococcales bacterium]|nr:kelch repeat-containing protein [Myxococcales bacterium]
MRTPLLLLLCSTLAIACTPSVINNDPPRLDGAVPTDVPPGIDSPVVPDGTIAPDVVVTPDDTVAPDDAVTNPDVPADVPIMPTACRSSRDCARGVCDRVRSVCVECITAAQCGGSTPVCQANRCAPAVACMSSRMCPGQVCDTARAVCVDCVSDPDCMSGNVCVRNNCLPAPLPCRSSRECSTLDQVCDASRGVCVDCVTDVDCPAAQFCTPERMCTPQVCTPGTRECLDLRRIRTCNTNGSGWVESPCGSGASCVDNRCQAQVCSPGSASCASMTQRRVCNPDGLGYTPTECAAMESCSLGTCRAWGCTPGATTCQSSTSVAVCNADGLGTRSMSCPAGSSCTDGRCSSWVCTPGAYSCASTAERRVCNADGLGYAPAACPLPANATATACTSGMCSFTCAAGFGDCDGVASNGCETNLTTSAIHCGTCGQRCSAGGSTGSTSVCVAGACMVTCSANYADCDGSPGNGCEVFTASDVRNCGGCGAMCPVRPNSVASCAVGRCGFVCLSGFSDCDGDPANGCERALGTDVAHCGRCNNACPTGPNARVTCSNFACTFACESGFSNCDALSSTGCEAVTATDLNNCGACNRRCAPANATGACAASVCTIAACAAGFGDCDGSASNGCEASLQTSTSHCGMCGRACPGAGTPGTSVTCTAGVCGSVCLTGYADCDGNAANGCEANLGADGNHCGACGMVCPSGQSCVARVCTAAPPGSLNTGRYGFGAATAPDGRVYVFGGYNGGYLNSVEMFDPATNRWTVRAPLPNSPWAVTGAALADGRILSISGYAGSTYTTTVYAYNPTTNAWTAIAPVLTGRYHATATRGIDGRVFLFGGRTSAGMATTAEAYNPVSNAWTAIRAPVTARVGANAVTAPDGRVFLFGGGTNTDGTSSTLSVEIYDPVANTWSAGPALTTSRTFSGAALGTDGRIYIAGGYTGSNYQATATAFAPAAGTYTSITGLNVSHGYVRLTPLLDGRILAIAGSNTTSTYLTRVEAYSPATNLWR